MSTDGLLGFFAARRDRGVSLAMVTVYETQGSTYSKAGARMLIDADGVFHGMLSGGCLEGDLAVRAAAVIESGRAQTVSYDLAQDDDELWGMGVGCDGLIRVFLQPVHAASDHEPFRSIAEVLAGESEALSATVITSGHAGLAPGATTICRDGEYRSFGADDSVSEALEHLLDEAAGSRESRLIETTIDSAEVGVLLTPITPPPRLLVLGAGLDAEPVVRFATELGWRVTVADHRPAYLEHGDFGRAEASLCVPAAALAERLDLSRFDFAIVMSHHLVSDRSYLTQLAASPVAHIGLLGPRARRQRLESEIGDAAPALAGRLHGPAGLDIGGRGPAVIALSIIAEMQASLRDRN